MQASLKLSDDLCSSLACCVFVCRQGADENQGTPRYEHMTAARLCLKHGGTCVWVGHL